MISDLKTQFDSYYNQHLLGKFVELEQVRLECLVLFFKRLFLFWLVCPVLMFLLWKGFLAEVAETSSALMELFQHLVIFYIVLALFVCYRPVQSYLFDVKYEVMKIFAKFWGNFTYSCSHDLLPKELNDSSLFPPIGMTICDDFFQGTYQGVKTTILDASLYKTIYTKKGKRDVLTFQGIIISLQMNKRFDGKTVVLKDKKLLNFMQNIAGTERVKLEDIVFEKEFEVFSNNQIEARYLLTTAFMERMLTVKKAFFGKDIQFSFYNRKLVIAIRTNHNMFEVSSLFSRATNRKMIDKAFEQFSSVVNIIEILKLDQRLGL